MMMTLRSDPPEDQTAAATQRAAAQEVSSEALLNGRRELVIRHGNDLYRLRRTSNDKLILTK